MSDYNATTFLNVDLDLYARADLTPLVRAFGERVSVLFVGKDGRRYSAHLELRSNRHSQNPDLCIRRFVALVRRLPPSARKHWNNATVREFNIGTQAWTTPHAFELRLRPETVAAVAHVGAQIGITVYACDAVAAYTAHRRKEDAG